MMQGPQKIYSSNCTFHCSQDFRQNMCKKKFRRSVLATLSFYRNLINGATKWVLGSSTETRAPKKVLPKFWNYNKKFALHSRGINVLALSFKTFRRSGFGPCLTKWFLPSLRLMRNFVQKQNITRWRYVLLVFSSIWSPEVLCSSADTTNINVINELWVSDFVNITLSLRILFESALSPSFLSLTSFKCFYKSQLLLRCSI